MDKRWKVMSHTSNDSLEVVRQLGSEPRRATGETLDTRSIVAELVNVRMVMIAAIVLMGSSNLTFRWRRWRWWWLPHGGKRWWWIRLLLLLVLLLVGVVARWWVMVVRWNGDCPL
jgi:hypothetical protein